jgi:hypothetical protein
MAAFEAHLHHPTIAATAAALTEEWGVVITYSALSNAMNVAFAGHDFRETAGREWKMSQYRERMALVESGIPPRSLPTADVEVARSEPVPGRHGQRVIVIPDTQVRADSPLENLDWISRYIEDQRPDGVLHLGDHWDNNALSSYTPKAKAAFEHRQYRADTDRANEGMQRLSAYRSTWKPTWEWYLDGNHDHRVTRVLEDEPQWIGQIGLEDRWLEGWTVHPFLKVVTLPDTDILACHYFTGPTSPRPIGGTAHNLLSKVGKSCIMGHRQVLDSAVKYLPNGEHRRALICGAAYHPDQDEDYRQSNGEWRGIIMLNEVIGGSWDQCEVSLGYLQRRYGTLAPAA